jgi:hypothetical protein|tara:strand:- start:445 stop:1224 length:780 start_codon:yes stop_codon:yes gene_type:complete
MSATTTGNDNTAVGWRSLYANTTGPQNVAVGYSALVANTTGEANTAVGYNAGDSVTTGANNAFLGAQAGHITTDGARNTCAGNLATTGASNNDAISIGYNVAGTTNGGVLLGSGSTTIGIQLDGSTTTWTAASDSRLKTNISDFTTGLSFIDSLNPVSYTWKKKKDVVSSLTTEYVEGSEEYVRGVTGEQKTYVGFLAQDIKTSIDAYSIPNGTSLWTEDANGIQGVGAGDLIPTLVNAVQELKALNDALTTRIIALEG